MSCHQRATENVDDLYQKHNQTVTRLLDLEQYGLDIVLEEDARDDALVDLVALLRDGVLVGEKRVRIVRARGADAVDGGDDRHKVLELVEVGGGDVDGAVEGILKGGVEAAKGELVDDVREVESCGRQYITG